jgi:hypothetical protein
MFNFNFGINGVANILKICLINVCKNIFGINGIANVLKIFLA